MFSSLRRCPPLLLKGGKSFALRSLNSSKFPFPLAVVSLSSRPLSFPSAAFSTSSSASSSSSSSPPPLKEAEIVNDVKSPEIDEFADPEESAESKEMAEKEKKIAEESRAAIPSVTKREQSKMSFQAETKQILDIMANALYTDKEVFLREIISNASDALEKCRYFQSSGKGKLLDEGLEFSIKIFTDEEKGVLIIQDTGIGMTKQELIENLGTIARSGSKQFMNKLKAEGTQNASTANIIGQFGVGFYSTFMVGNSVEVFSTSAVSPDGGDAKSYQWTSDGNGEFELAEIERQPRGTKIVIHLKDSAKEFSQKFTIESIIRKYSNFVGFPIYYNGSRINTVSALWLQGKDDVKDEQYAEFYKYYCQAYDTPTYRLHFSMDSPIDIHALFFFPERHMEKFGMGRMEPGVAIYSRKILIKPKAKEILPEWMRFVKGVVDSEDIPLNISRETMQDSRLISRLNAVLSKKIIKYLIEESQKNPEKYTKFYNEFNGFLKEGVVTDYSNRTEVAKLLRFESSLEAGKLFSIDEYISRMPPSQKSVLFLQAPNRTAALSSPYFESLKAKGVEVLFLYQPIDEFVMQQLAEYGGRKLRAIDSAEEDEENKADKPKGENSSEEKEFLQWIQSVLESSVSSVEPTESLVDSPVVVRSSESASLRKMMKMVEQQSGGSGEFSRPLAKQKMEINLKHPIIQKLMETRKEHTEVAKTVAEQLYDNALLQADLMEHPRQMISRIHKLMDLALTKNK